MTRRVPPSAPVASARLQLHAEFGFAAAAAQLDYLQSLGISHLYLSPILRARAGSMHGYDVVDHSLVSPELGGEDGYRALVAAARARGLQIVVDIVPNHMAVGGADNALWLDVLEWGPRSRYAKLFDIDWDAGDPELQGRLLIPMLADHYGAVLTDGGLTLDYDADAGRFAFAHHEHRFPVSPGLYPILLKLAGPTLAVLAPEFRGLRPGARFEAARAALRAAVAAAPEELAALLAAHNPETTEGQGRLHRLLGRQHYRLSGWRNAADEINWRRFFDVTTLAGLRIEEPFAFELVHATTFRLYAEGLIDGLRIDHVDGLADPRGYCRQLRRRLTQLARQRPADAPAGPAYLLVEKILAPGERMPADWQVDGTTGYSFMNEVGALLHDARGEAPLRALWTELTGRSGAFEAEEAAGRRRIPQDSLAAEFQACAHAFHRLARSELATRDWSLAAIRRVLAEVLVSLPVYRSYIDSRGRSDEDAALLREAFADAAPRCRPSEAPLLDVFDRWLGGESPSGLRSSAARRARLRAIARFQQLSAPVAAKSVEDTAFYRFGLLLSRNEVGSNPGQFQLSADEFHAECARRAEHFPRALLATATHDHKRGEDARMRLALLSETPELWIDAVRRWHAAHEPAKPREDGHAGPDAADELMLYQTLYAAWPATLRADDTAGVEALRERVAGWQVKSIREAKRRSGWTEPNPGYERCAERFLAQLLAPGSAFAAELEALVRRSAAAGAVKSLVQALLKLTAPGVPDLYQGSDFWDHSLVDPDNRRPVDYAARAAALAGQAEDRELLDRWQDGAVKQRLIARVLAARRQCPALFTEGAYLPLSARSDDGRPWLAFAREHGRERAVVLVPLAAADWLDRDSLAPPPEAAAPTVELPAHWPQDLEWTAVLGTTPVALLAILRAEPSPWPCRLYLAR